MEERQGTEATEGLGWGQTAEGRKAAGAGAGGDMQQGEQVVKRQEVGESSNC